MKLIKLNESKTLSAKGLNALKKRNKSLKESFSDSDIRHAIFRVHDVMDAEYTELLTDLVDRALLNLEDNGGDVDSAVWGAMDEGLIYTKDQWTVISNIIDPDEIGVEGIMEKVDSTLFNDISTVIDYLQNDNDK